MSYVFIPETSAEETGQAVSRAHQAVAQLTSRDAAEAGEERSRRLFWWAEADRAEQAEETYVVAVSTR